MCLATQLRRRRRRSTIEALQQDPDILEACDASPRVKEAYDEVPYDLREIKHLETVFAKMIEVTGFHPTILKFPERDLGIM
eukprot:COSAG05_NODE_2924_length_2499_cov_1.503333_2_plen_81_part_00